MYRTPDPNAPITLGVDLPVVARIADRDLDGVASLLLRWLPRPRIEVELTLADSTFVFQASNGLLREEGVGVSIPALSVDAPMSVRSYSIGESSTLVGSFCDVAVSRDSSPCECVDFELANVPVLYSPIPDAPQRLRTTISLTSEHWNVELSPDPAIHETAKNLDATRGYGITYHGMFCRSDRSLFNYGEAAKFSDCLNDFLSFAFGAWTPPLLNRGRVGESIVWQELQVRRADDWKCNVVKWLDEHHAHSSEQLFDGFLRLSQDAVWSLPMRSAIYWYVNASTVTAVETGIVLSAAAMEVLAWTRLVLETKTLSANQFDDLHAAGAIRYLLNSLSIPTAVPSELNQLSRVAQEEKWEDGPQALVRARNAIVHPRLDKRLRYTDALGEIWKLSLWYLEMTVLRLCGFDGSVASRLNALRWAGQVEVVPWAR